jgi:hypothetical protein
MALRSVLALVVVIAMACSPTASSPTPTPTASSSTPTVTASPTPSPSRVARVTVSDTTIATSAGSFVLFQLPGEPRLRAITWDASFSGILPVQVPADAVWSQSPYGATFRIGSTITARDGPVLAVTPWPSKITPAWSLEGTTLCAAVPERDATGAALRLETFTFEQSVRIVASGFTTYGDNAGYPVLACDTGTDRAIVALFGQGIALAKLWVFRLSSGALIRSVDYSGLSTSGGWVAASADGSMLAETVRSGGAGGPWKATIRATDDGAQLGTIDGFVVHGFSGDKSLVIGANETSAAVIDWKTGRKIWSAPGPYGGYLAEPGTQRVAVGIGFVGGSDQRDVYLVNADGSAALLPARVRVGLR